MKEKLPTGISVAFGILSEGFQVVLGFVLGIALNLAVIFGTNFLLSGDIFYSSGGPILFYFFYFLGATQLIWLLPLILLLREKYNHITIALLAPALIPTLLFPFFLRLSF